MICGCWKSGFLHLPAGILSLCRYSKWVHSHIPQMFSTTHLLSQSFILGQPLVEGKHWDAHSKDSGWRASDSLGPTHGSPRISGFHDLLQCFKILKVCFCLFSFFFQAIGTLEMESVPYSYFCSSIHLTSALAFQTFLYSFHIKT